MRRNLTLALVVMLASTAHPIAAAPKKKPARKFVVVKPNPAPAPAPITIEPVAPSKGGFMVPKAVVLRTMTPNETAANAIWTMRAALNVAALQCQFSPFLDTVKIYNAVLKHHSDELTRAQTTMQAHFRRYDGPAKAINSFDQYTTRTYNSFSTLDAQYSFCDEAARVGREIMSKPRGGMGAEALLRNPEIRAALAEKPLSPALAVIEMAPIDIPLLTVEP